MRLLSLLAAVLFGLATPVFAESVSFETCSDAQGKPVKVEPVSSLTKLVSITARQGQRLIQYNPELLPTMSASAKQFFYAQACASLALGATANNEPGMSRAKRADCVALRALRLSGLLASGDVSSLQRELTFTDEEWEQLPGPRRHIDLASCAEKPGIALPSGVPTAAQLKWNACIRPCSDRLFQCQRQCAGSACVDACLKKHEICEAACNEG